ncbi:MAG TPA: hypothetical protein P5234_16295 [Thermoanaerobaculaceae bacterium]|nr:hypothetical protein [Thermoanaerobaculaceae bacterium]
MKALRAVLGMLFLFPAWAMSLQPQQMSMAAGIEVLQPVLSQAGVTESPARLRLSHPGEGGTPTIELDGSLEHIDRVVRAGDTAVVIARDKYAWSLQQVDLAGRKASPPLRCGHPRPEVSPDGTRLAYVRGDISRGDSSTYGSVVMVLDLARTQPTPVFPEENVAADMALIREWDEAWHEQLWGNILWEPSGAAVVFVASRGSQWWDLDLCRVELSARAGRPVVARKRISFSPILKEGIKQSESCKFVPRGLEWLGPKTVRLSLEPYSCMRGSTIDLETAGLTDPSSDNASEQAKLELGLETKAPGGLQFVDRTPWPWVSAVLDDGTVQTLMGERITYASATEDLALTVRYAVFSNPALAAQGLRVTLSAVQRGQWARHEKQGSSPCEADECWVLQDKEVLRVGGRSGSVCFLFSARIFGEPGVRQRTAASSSVSATVVAALGVAAREVGGRESPQN